MKNCLIRQTHPIKDFSVLRPVWLLFGLVTTSVATTITLENICHLPWPDLAEQIEYIYIVTFNTRLRPAGSHIPVDLMIANKAMLISIPTILPLSVASPCIPPSTRLS